MTNAQSKTLIFCASNFDILQCIDFVNEHKSSSQITIFVSKKNLYKFFRVVSKTIWKNDIDIRFLLTEIRPSQFFLFRLPLIRIAFFSICLRVQLKNLHRRLFSTTKNAQILFFSRGAVPFFQYHFDRLKRDNIIIYQENRVENKSDYASVFDAHGSAKNRLTYILNKWIYSSQLDLFIDHGFIFSWTSDRFIARCKQLPTKKDYHHIHLQLCQIFESYYDAPTLFFDQDIDMYLDEKAGPDFLAKLSQTLTDQFGKNFKVKLHPAQKTSLLQNLVSEQIIPGFVYGEAAFQAKNALYISFFSYLILDDTLPASSKRVLLSEMVPYKTEVQRQTVKDYVSTYTHQDIFYPTSFEALNSYLNKR